MGNVAMPITAEKAQNFGSNIQTITSMEVAEMVGKRHDHLIRDIKKYIVEINAPNFGEVNIADTCSTDFFQESTYIDSKGDTQPCYDVTKKGYEFVANKFAVISKMILDLINYFTRRGMTI